MKVFCLQVGPLATNAYIVGGASGAEAAVIDPGGDAARIAARCRREGLEPIWIVNTHAHADHIAANAVLKREFPRAALCIGQEDAAALTDADANLSAAFGASLKSPAADRLLAEGDVVQVGTVALAVLETPGHTPGSISLLARGEEPPQLFCGDLLFCDGVGRTDLPGGDWATLLHSIRQKAFALPDETVVWPGHGEPTTIGQERRHNPFAAEARAEAQR